MMIAAAGLLLLTIFAMIGVAIEEHRRRRRKIELRMASARAFGTRIEEKPKLRVSREAPAPRAGLRAKIGAVFGFHPDRKYPMSVAVVITLGLIAGTAAWLLGHGVLGAASLLLVPVVCIVVTRQMFNRWHDRSSTALLAQLPDALSMIVRAVRVGIPVTEAIRIAGRESPEPTASVLRQVAEQIAIGISLETALQSAGTSTGLPEYRFFATALSLQAQTGGGLSETLENLADVIRKRVAMRARGYALAAEARTSTLVLSCLPIVSGFMIWVLSPAYIGMLFSDPSGQKLLAGAVGLLITGTLVMRTIIRKSLS
jgi:tight adherence protein B